VIEQLVKNHPEHEYVLFLKSSERSYPFPYLRKNVQLVYCPLKINLLSNLLCLPWKGRKLNLDILLTQNYSAPFIKTKKATLVLDVIFKSDPQYFTLIERIYFFFIKPLLRYSDTVLTISEYERKNLKTYGFILPNQSSSVLHLGVDHHFLNGQHSPEELVEFKRKWNLPGKFILYVGRINLRKNIQNLIKSMIYVKSDISLVLCGKEDWKVLDIERIIKKNKLEERVVRIGYLEDRYLPLLYKSAELFAYVSFQEGFGLPPIEAMACGIPVVVSQTSSLPEICGDAAQYVNPHDPEDIAKGINKIISDSRFKEKLKEKGKQRAQQFTWDKTACHLLNILSETASKVK
jgi:glycosyltransferase involved in cell wall biosynthesis